MSSQGNGQGKGIQISVINSSTALTDAELADALPAFQKQISRDLLAAWGQDATLHLVKKGATPPAGSWWFTVLDDAEQGFQLGYHDLTPEGLPAGRVYARTAKVIEARWTVVFSHELLEMIIDPDVNLAVFQQTGDVLQLYAYEVCDACRADEHAYEIDGVTVSNFVYPAWFESFQKSPARFDHVGKITAPFQLLSGGYISVNPSGKANGWQLLTADGATPPPTAPAGTRRERRSTPRKDWKNSQAGR
jgi:hypothetical protein